MGSEQVDPAYPSLDVIRTELDIRLTEQERRGGAFDNRAGLVLAFGGVLIGLSPESPTVWHILGQVAAAIAAAIAGSALWPRVSGSVGPRQLRANYLMHDPEHTKLRLLDTRIWLYERDEERLETKVARLKIAVLVLASSVPLMLMGSIVEYART